MNNRIPIKLSSAVYNRSEVVEIHFRYDDKIIRKLRNIPGARWNPDRRCWYIQRNRFNLELFLAHFREFASVDRTAMQDTLHEYNTNSNTEREAERNIESRAEKGLPEGYLEILERKRYSKNTIRIYTNYMTDFMEAFRGRDVSSVSTEDINAYILQLIRSKRISHSQQNQRINAIKFYYEKVLHRRKSLYSIERPRKTKALPHILSESEVISLLNAIDNVKHKAIIATIYSAGLRRSELINLRKQDIDFDRKVIYLRGTKGRKDRTSLLSDTLVIVLKRYLGEHKPNYWLFEGLRRKQYSATSIAMILKRARSAAGIEKNVTPHTLRHSFATHLLEQGVDIRYIQTLLGHESSKSTEIYTHVSKKSLANIKSPLDVILHHK